MTSSPQVDQEDTDYIDFEQYWLILKRRWLPATVVASSVVGIAALVTFTQKPVYQAGAKLLFNKQSNVSSLTGLSETVGELSGITNLSNPLETEAEVIRSNPIIQKTIDKFNLRDKKGDPISVESFLKQLKVKSVRGTDVLELSYKSTDPQQAAAIVNSLMKDYIDNNISVNTAEARAAREFLNKQLPRVESRVVEAEAELRKFKEANKVVALEEEAKFGVESLKDSLEELTKAEAQLAAANTRSQALQRELNIEKQKAVEVSELSQSPAVQQVLQEYQKVQDELAVARTRLTNEHPTVVNLAQKERALRNQLEKRVGQVVGGNSNSLPKDNLQVGELKQTLTSQLLNSEVERLAAANQVGVLRKAFALQRARLTVLPKLEQQQRQLERRLQIAQITYQELLKKLQEVQVLENQNIGNARIISEALVPEQKISPRIQLNLLLGGFLGVLLGAGTALILEAMDKSLKTVDQAKRLLSYPLLGTIPKIETKGVEGNPELPTLNNPYSVESSAFEMLQTNLSFTVSDKTLKVIMVTSSTPGEGKSLVSANLAVAMSQLGGQRVLLIDGDMRLPRQHKLWELHSFSGLSNVLVGKAVFRDAIQEALPTLDLLPGGKVPPNPATLIDSQRMADLIEEAKEEYDFIIIDTPPLTAAADSLILSKFADGTLLVVRPGVVTSDGINAAKNQLEQSGQQVLGMALNGITPESGYGGYYPKSYYGSKRERMEEKVSV